MNREEEQKQIYLGRYPLPLDATTKKSYKILLYRSNKSDVEIIDFIIPELPENYYVIGTKDLDGDSFTIEGESMPILAKDKIDYLGQPIFIIAGLEMNILQKIHKKIHINYKESTFKPQTVLTIDFSKPRIKEFHKKISGTIITPERHISKNFTNGVFIKKEADNLLLYTFARRSFDLISNISKLCKIDKEKIKIISPFIQPDPDLSLYDNIYFSLLTVVTQNKLKKNMLFDSLLPEKYHYSSRILPIKANWCLFFNTDNELLGGEIDIKLDLGAYPILCKEKALRLIHGVTSYYKIKNINVRLTAKTSPNPPSGIFNGLYLPEGIFICETLINKIVSTTSHNNLDFRLDTLMDKGFKSNTNVIIKRDIPLKKILLDLAIDSDFRRMNSAINLSNRNSQTSNILLTRRGIGIASGYHGNNYISNTKNLCINSVTVALLRGEKVSITFNTGINNLMFFDLWKSTASEILGVLPENVDINSNYEDMENPILIEGININIITPLVTQCCEEIKSRRFKDPLPIIQTKSTRRLSVKSWNPQFWIGTPFKNSSFGACVVEVEINKRELLPSIKEMWLRIDVGNILDEPGLRKSVEREITSIVDNILTPIDQSPYSIKKNIINPKINLYFFENTKNKKESRGLGALIQGIIPGAFLQAVNQALNANYSKLPISREEIAKELIKNEF